MGDAGQDRKLSAQEKIARLRAGFLAQLPERVAQVRELLERLHENPEDGVAAMVLHRQLHSLKGTARSFGFSELGEAAALSEDLATQLAAAWSPPLPADWSRRLAACIESVEMTAEVLCSSEDDESDVPVINWRSLSSEEGQDRAGRLVYVCDDEPLVAEQLCSQLVCFGYDAVSFTEPKKLREAVLAHLPDVVIMDIQFPAEARDGAEFLAALWQETEQVVPSIFLSARSDFDARLKAVEAGGEAYFCKPARALELVGAIDELTHQQPHEPYRIMVVDDESAVAAYHAVILQEAGMATCQVNAAEQVLDVLREFRPDMVLMDMYMPRCNGRDLAKVVRQLPEYVGLPIVFLSSETDRKKQFSAMRIGAEGFLTKPVVPEELVDAVAIRAERMRTLRGLMARDSLTGLFNHTTTTQLLDNAISAVKRSGQSLCFVMIDIDHFKSVNDTHGHPVGDRVILVLARILQQRLRNSDVVGRYGGEEFAVILQGMAVEQAFVLVDELRQDFSQVVFHSDQGDFKCTFSAGIACYPAHRRLDALRAASDKALYEAKRAGRNRVVVD